MITALVIYLAGPMASFGESAGNVERGTADRPTRSAVLGLAGAAMGVDRDDAPGQRALNDSFAFASRTLSSGVLMTDFHTYEGVQTSSKHHYATRAIALANGTRNTTITRREYRMDGAWQVAYMLKPSATLTLQNLKSAFEAPRYSLFLGRKSCPLAHPLAPQITQAQDLESLFRTALPSLLDHDGGPAVIACEDMGLVKTNQPVRQVRRLDQPVDRQQWTFKARDEFEFMTSTETPTWSQDQTQGGVS